MEAKIEVAAAGVYTSPPTFTFYIKCTARLAESEKKVTTPEEAYAKIPFFRPFAFVRRQPCFQPCWGGAFPGSYGSPAPRLRYESGGRRWGGGAVGGWGHSYLFFLWGSPFLNALSRFSKLTTSEEITTNSKQEIPICHAVARSCHDASCPCHEGISKKLIIKLFPNKMLHIFFTNKMSLKRFMFSVRVSLNHLCLVKFRLHNALKASYWSLWRFRFY